MGGCLPRRMRSSFQRSALRRCGRLLTA